jgi:RND family efflux transporter MFP subunit
MNDSALAARSSGIFILGALLLAGCGHNHNPEGSAAAVAALPSVPVRIETVRSQTSPSIEEVVGTVRARLRATLEAKVSGRIAEMPVMLGQRVKAGQLLARLDAAEIKARLDQAQAGLQQAERDWKRVSSLFDQQATTHAEYDAADARYLVAKAGLAEAQAMMAYVDVLAPFDGVITRKRVDVGDQAVPGKPLIEVEDPSALQLEADVPEAVSSHIQQGARMFIRVDSHPDELSGTVSEMASADDPISRTFRVKLDLPAASDAANSAGLGVSKRSEDGLRSGQFARLLVPVGESTTLRVPAAAIVQRGQMEIVFAVENQRAQLRLVRTGRQFDGQIEILAGLDNGDAVVVENAAQLVDGQPVTAR